MKMTEADVLELSKRIRFAVDNDPLAKDAFERIASRIQAKSNVATSAKDVSDIIDRRKPMTDAAQAAIVEFAEEHSIRVR